MRQVQPQRGARGQDRRVSEQQEEPVDTEYVGPCRMGWNGDKEEQMMIYGS